MMILNSFFICRHFKKYIKVSINGDYIEIKLWTYTFAGKSFFCFVRKKLPNPIIEINKLDAKALIEAFAMCFMIEFISFINGMIFTINFHRIHSFILQFEKLR